MTNGTPETQEPQVQEAQTGQVSQEERTMSMLAHLGGILFLFLAPLVIWLIHKDKMPFVDEQGKEALNFQITIAIGYVAATILTVIGIGILLWIALPIINLVYCLIAGLKANEGVAYKYPSFALRLIK